jgi:hypothetical protein
MSYLAFCPLWTVDEQHESRPAPFGGRAETSLHDGQTTQPSQATGLEVCAQAPALIRQSHVSRSMAQRRAGTRGPPPCLWHHTTAIHRPMWTLRSQIGHD